MDDLNKVERWMLDDGRRAEKKIVEIPVCGTKDCEDGEGERVVEFRVEDERPLRLKQRVKEKTRPFVFERLVETIDPLTGEVIEKKLESIDPKVQMQVVEHIGLASPEVAAQSVPNDCHVTKEEMIDAVVAAVKAFKDVPNVQMQSMPKNLRGLQTLGFAEEIEKRVDLSGYSQTDKVLLGVIVAQIIFLGYIIFFM